MGVVALRLILLLAFVLRLVLQLGCTGDAEGLFELARFEERQGNTAHARELYEQIIRDYPQSDPAARARTRLERMESAAGE